MKSFPLYGLYEKTLLDLKAGKRPNLTLSPEELAQCKDYFIKLNGLNAETNDYLPLLALLDHSRKSHPDLQDPLIEVLKNRQEPELLVHCLSCCLKVIIGECERKGERIPFKLLEALKVPLTHSNLEVLEWALRVLEQTGSQSILLKENARAIRLKPWPIFSKHKKNIKALLEFLEKRWNPAPQRRR